MANVYRPEEPWRVKSNDPAQTATEKGYGALGAPRPLGEVPQRIECVSSSLSEVEALVAQLHGLLSPILVPAVESNAGRATETAATELGAMLQSIETRNHMLAQDLRELVSRIAL